LSASAEGINRLLSNPNLSPRERVRIREQAIKAGVKGTSLHLGQATPEVINQLEKSKSQQKRPEKAAVIQQQIDVLKSQGIVTGNTSGAEGQARSKANAQAVFRIERKATESKNIQVRSALQSPEFIALKEKGVKGANTTVLNQRNIAFPKVQTQIINEVAQVNIQGKTATQSNINSILEKAGLAPHSITITDRGTLEGTPNTSKIVQEINSILDVGNTGIGSDSAGVDNTVHEITDPITNLVNGDQGDQGTSSGIADLINKIISNPLTLAVVGFAVILFVYASTKPVKSKEVVV